MVDEVEEELGEAEVQEEEGEVVVVKQQELEPEVAPDLAAVVQFSSNREEPGADLGAEDHVEDLQEEEEELPGEPGPDPDQLVDGSTIGSRVQEADLASV